MDGDGSSSIVALTSPTTPITRLGTGLSRRIEMYFPTALSRGQYLRAKDALTIVTRKAWASSASVKLRPSRIGIFNNGRNPESTKRSEACSYSPGFEVRPAIVTLVQKWFPWSGKGYPNPTASTPG